MGNHIQEKLSQCGRDLHNWGRHLYHQIRERIRLQKELLLRLKGRRDEASLSLIAEVEEEFQRLLKCEEAFWSQRAKLFWLHAGDMNNRAFHSFANGKKNKQMFNSLQDEQGNWVQKGPDLNALVSRYFAELYKGGETQMEDVISCVQKKVIDAHNELLIAPFRQEEVKEVVFSMHKDKAPREDGFNPAFYQKYWHIVGQEVTQACLGWLNTGSLPEGINNTILVLIPKRNRPTNMKELRPIALCNVIYKVTSKVLANRLRLALTEIIDETQSGFVAGRLITDNIVVANEVVNWLKGKRRGNYGLAAMKIDIAKAYDKMECQYLERVMVAIGFCQKWVDLMMMCVRSVKYKVIVGEEIVGPIVPERGL